MFLRIIVAFCLLYTTCCIAQQVDTSLRQIESEWARIYYSVEQDQRAPAYQQLLNRASELAEQYPDRAEPIIWKAIVIASNAEHQNGFDALADVHQARDLLLQAIAINPAASEGSAYVSLGSLYYMVPSWPIGFGDEEQAKQMLTTALTINPNGIDSNFFYGDFLSTQKRHAEAAKFFKKAISAPVRPEQVYADRQLQKEAKLALDNTNQHRISERKSWFMSSSSSASAGQY